MGGTDAPVVVLTALEVEYKAVRAYLRDVSSYHHDAGTVFEVGRLPGGRQVVLGVTGTGNPGAAVLTERAIGEFRPAGLVFVGVAGALADDMAPGDVVVATRVYGFHGGRDDAAGFSARPRSWDAPHEWEQAARQLSRDDRWLAELPADYRGNRPVVHFRPVAAGEVVLNSRVTPLAAQIRGNYDDAAAIEMESAGVAQAGHLNRSLPVLTVRGISDLADGAKYVMDVRGWQSIAAAHAAAFATVLIAALDDAVVLRRAAAAPGGQVSVPARRAAAPTRRPAPSSSVPDPRAVLVIHGRDEQARQAVAGFLRSLDLRPLDWEESVSRTGSAAPFIGEVIARAFQEVQAAVVLLTPDDVVSLHPSLRGADEPEGETEPTGQARPDVLIGAGMALALYPERTVLLQIGQLRPLAVLEGRSVIRVDERPQLLVAITQRLKVAGCAVNDSGADWLDLTRFTGLDAHRRSP